MAEWSKALRSGRSPLLWAGVRISLLTKLFFYKGSRVAQWKRAGPITQRSVDRNYALLVNIFHPKIHTNFGPYEAEVQCAEMLFQRFP